MHRLHALSWVLILMGIPGRVRAQVNQPQIPLRLSRTFGYAGGGRIQGTFKLSLTASEDIERVEFLIDGQVLSVDPSPPFSHSFNTSEYPAGPHTFSAIVFLTNGAQKHTTLVQREFISPEAAWISAREIIFPILIGALALTLLSTVIPILLGRASPFRPGEYGIAGGAICPNCEKPFNRHLFSPNLFFGKLERCPHCGKWSLVRRASASDLETAEARLALGDQKHQDAPGDSEEKYRRLLDDSRFED